MQTFDFGPNAQALPNSEIIHSFDPLAHRIQGAAGVASIPDSPQHLLRWYPPRPNSMGALPITPLLIESHIQRAQTHLTTLREVADGALEIPSHRSFISPHPSDASKLAILSIVEKIPGTARGLEADQPESAAALYGLTQYVQWLISSGQREVLSDIFKPGQYIAAKATYLADIDPMLCSVAGREELLKRYAPPLGIWRQHLPDVPYALAADKVLIGFRDKPQLAETQQQEVISHKDLGVASLWGMLQTLKHKI